MPKIRYARPAEMAPHPMLKRVGMMVGLADHFAARSRKAGKNRDEHKERAAELEGDWQALVESVKANGILEPIKICKIPATDWNPKPLGAEYWVVDGRNRWMAAQHAKLRRVPYLLVRPEDASAIILATVTGRRHYTKGATAYLAVLMHPEVATAGDERRAATQFRSRTECGTADSPSRTECGTGTPSALSAEGLASRFAVSTRLLEQAAKLFRLVEKHPHLRESAEADVWAGCGLGGIIAGLESMIAAGKVAAKEPADRKAFLAWATIRGFAAEHKKLADRWSDLSAEQRDQAVVLIREAAAALPSEIRHALAEVGGGRA